MTWVSFLRNKYEAFGIFKVFKKVIENKMEMRIKYLRSDNGGEFTSREFEKFLEEEGIRRKYSIARTPQQNGVAERKNHTTMEMARKMLSDSKLSDRF